MKEVFFSDYLEKQAKKSLVACVASAVVAMSLVLTGVAIGAAIILVSGLVAVVMALFVAATRGPVYTAYRCGMRGEQVLRAHLLSSGLGDHYTAYYNLPLNGNGRNSDIDCVLVGPSGPFVFEVKHHHGLIFYRNGVWARIKMGRKGTLYRVQLGDPGAQLYRNIRKLKEMLGHTDGFWFHGAVVFTNPQAVLDIEGLRWVRAITVRGPGADPFRKNGPFRRADSTASTPASPLSPRSNYGKMEIMLRCTSIAGTGPRIRSHSLHISPIETPTISAGLAREVCRASSLWMECLRAPALFASFPYPSPRRPRLI